jgi:hypothetical protein
MAIMNTASSRTASQQIAGEIQLARLRLAKAERQLRSAKQQARLARRRRKEAKLAARRAKKQARLAKQEFAEAEQALAEAEAKLIRSRKSTARIKGRKAEARKAIVARKKAARPAASALQKSVKPGVNQPTLVKRASNAKPRVRKAARPVAVPRDFETPTATVSGGGQTMIKTETASGESPPDEAAAGSPVQSDHQAQ